MRLTAILAVATNLGLFVAGERARWGGEADMVPGPIPARVLRVVDGDTLLVRARIWLGQEVETHVRLIGIDAPELKGMCTRERDMAVQARELVIALVGDRSVTLHDVTYDKFGRRVAARVVGPNGVDLARTLLERDLVRAYEGRGRRSWCDPAERD